MIFQLVISILIAVLSFTAYLMLRYMRKHPHLFTGAEADKK